jgi:type I restriction enzyme R subunit/putative DNA methylase
MHNHVHMLVWPLAACPKFMKTLKGFTAREANKLLGGTGEPFWQHESYDHWVRGPDEFTRIIAYIEENPVRAGLSRTAEEYPWSSAYRKPA